METINNNSKQSLDAILARDDYKRMTAALKEKVEKVAHRIYNKMEELDIDDAIRVDGITIKRCSVRANVGTYEYLAILDNDGDRFMPEEYQEKRSLQDIGKEYYYGGDFTAKVIGATNKDALAFLNAAKDFIVALGEVEQKKVDDIDEALEDNDNL